MGANSTGTGGCAGVWESYVPMGSHSQDTALGYGEFVMKNEEILKKLRDAGGYVSGQELCEYYGVSRTAVWKAVRQLEKDGYVIEAQNNKGYRLVEKEDADVFTKVEIESYMDTSWIGRKLVFHRETGSTNLDAKALAEKGRKQALSLWRTCRLQARQARQGVGVPVGKGHLYVADAQTGVQAGESLRAHPRDGALRVGSHPGGGHTGLQHQMAE